MRNFDSYFVQRWTFVFSDVRLTQRGSCETYWSNWSQDFCVLKYATQLSQIFQKSHCTFVTTLFRLYIWLFLNLPVRKRALIAEFTSLREDASSHKVIQCKYLSRSLCTAVDWVFPDGLLPLRFLFLDALLPRGVWSVFFGVDCARSLPS